MTDLFQDDRPLNPPDINTSVGPTITTNEVKRANNLSNCNCIPAEKNKLINSDKIKNN